MGNEDRKNELPIGWVMKRFDEIISRAVLGGNYENSESNSGIPVIKMGNIDRGKISIDKVQYLPFESGYNKNDILKKGDLLFNTRNTLDLVGKVSVWNEELPQALYNSNLLKLEFKGEVVESNFYMNYVFNSLEILGQLKARATGTTSVAAIYGRDLNSVKFVLPPIPEQRAISNVLSTWDTAIQTTQELISQKEQKKKWLMQNLLTGKKRLTGFNGEWKEYSLNYFIEELREKPSKFEKYEIFTSAKSGLMKQTDYYGDNRITNREDADYNVLPPGFITYRSRSDDGLFTFNKNNFSETGLISGYYPVFRSPNGDTDFILDFINYKKYKLAKYAIGTSQLVLSFGALKNAKFILPEFKEQTAISQVLQTADKEITLLKTKLEQQKLQKKGLMQVLLTGKVRVKN